MCATTANVVCIYKLHSKPVIGYEEHNYTTDMYATTQVNREHISYN